MSHSVTNHHHATRQHAAESPDAVFSSFTSSAKTTKTGQRRFPSPEKPFPHPGRFSLFYESNDNKLCVFEDSNGHLTAVKSTRLA